MIWFLFVVCLGLVAYCIKLHIDSWNMRLQLDRHQVAVNKLRPLQDEVTRLMTQMRRVETLGVEGMSELRDEMWNIQVIVSDALGELQVDMPIPANYDDIPDYDYRNDPGGRTIESLLRHRGAPTDETTGD